MHAWLNHNVLYYYNGFRELIEFDADLLIFMEIVRRNQETVDNFIVYE
jgi:hypothetical protein